MGGVMGAENKQATAIENRAEQSNAKKWVNRIIGLAGFLFMVFLVYKMIENKLG